MSAGNLYWSELPDIILWYMYLVNNTFWSGRLSGNSDQSRQRLPLENIQLLFKQTLRKIKRK